MVDPCTTDVPNSLMTQLATATALVDGEMRLHSPNPALCELLAAGERRLEGETLARLGLPVELVAAARRALAEQRVVQLRQLALTGRDGETHAVDVSLSPLDESRLLLEAHVLAPASTIGAARLSESLRGFAHEVKNPLAGLRGAAQLLRRRVAEPELQDLAELIIAEADRLGALANRLLQASGKAHLSHVNIHEVLERVSSLLAAQDGAPRQVRDFDPSLPPLRGDADRLTQLLLNLARNALEANAAALTWRTRAEHSARVGDRMLRLALRIDLVDDGDGVATELADTLFLPMVSGRVDGTGLGLALSQEIAREHGGALSYRSRPGETVFSLLLPCGESRD